MQIKILDYTIKTEDKFNFGLYKTVAKGSFGGKSANGNKDKFIGFYAILSGALNKIVNNELLESKDIVDAKTLIEAISTLKTHIDSAFNIKPKESLCLVA